MKAGPPRQRRKRMPRFQTRRLNTVRRRGARDWRDPPSAAYSRNRAGTTAALMRLSIDLTPLRRATTSEQILS